jgi:hypothetical protein
MNTSMPRFFEEGTRPVFVLFLRRAAILIEIAAVIAVATIITAWARASNLGSVILIGLNLSVIAATFVAYLVWRHRRRSIDGTKTTNTADGEQQTAERTTGWRGLSIAQSRRATAQALRAKVPFVTVAVAGALLVGTLPPLISDKAPGIFTFAFVFVAVFAAVVALSGIVDWITPSVSWSYNIQLWRKVAHVFDVVYDATHNLSFHLIKPYD